ncbi:MAG TPA: hypothetical protein DDY20_09740 [Desulfobulbaceae bacterium]|nr:hypothetical protein [Desulfobulbaceae bacterium]
MKKYLLVIIAGILGFAAMALAFLGYSTDGLCYLVRTAGRVLPGTFSVASVQGRLADTFSLEGVHYRAADLEIAVRDFSLSWRPASLLKMTLEISSIDMNGATLRLLEQRSASPPAATWAETLPSFNLPLAIRVEKAAVNSLNLFFLDDSAPVHIARATLEKASGKRTLLQVESLDVTAPDFRFKIGGEVEAGDTARSRFTLDCYFAPLGYFPMESKAEIEGTPEQLEVTMQVLKPFQGTLRGTATDLTEKLRWEAELQSDQVRLAEIGRDWPEFVLTRFKAAGSGTLADYSLLAEADMNYGPFQDIHLRTGIDGDAYGLTLSDTQLDRADETLRGHGILAWRDTFSWQAELAGKRVSLSNINPAWPDGVLANIALSGRGAGDTYSLQVESEAAYAELRDIHVRGVIDGNADGLRFKDTQLDLPEGALKAEGQLAWLEAFTWQAEVNGTGINPGPWQPQYPGLLNFQAVSSGSLAQDTLKVKVDLVSLDGQLREYPVQASGKIELDGNHLEIDHLSLQAAGSSVLASGRYADTVDLGFELQAANLATVWPGASGSVRARGRLDGNRRHPSFQFSLSGDTVALDDFKLGTVAGDAQGSLAADGSLHARVSATEVAVADTRAGDFEAQLQGTTAAHRLFADIRSGADNAHLQFAGGISGSSWQGALEKADLNQEHLGTWQLLEATRISVSSRNIAVAPFCLAGTAPARVCLGGNSGPGGLWQAEARIESVPLQLLQFGRLHTVALEGAVSGVLALAGDRGEIKKGSLALATGSTSLVPLMPGKNSRPLTWQRNTLQAGLADNQFTANLYSMLSDGSTFVSSVRFFDVHPFPFSFEESRVEGSIEVDIKELQPLAALTLPDVDPSGALQGTIFLKGTIAHPTLFGTARLPQGKIRIPPLGISVEGLTISLDGSSPVFRVTASGSSGKGTLQLEGELLLAILPEPKLAFTIKGDRFEAASLPELKVILSPDLQGMITREKGEISGTIFIPEANIAPRDISGTVSASKDVVIVGSGKEPRTAGWPLSANVSVLAGDDVRVDAFGLWGKVKGRLEVSDLPGKPVTGDGILTVERGTFSIYGRELTIKTGRLLYNGNPLDNPGIDVRAESTTNEVTTGIQVTGFLNEPDISFYSTPPMEESVIISRLMMNTTLLGSSERDKGFLERVASRAGLDPVTSTVRGVKESLRLDEVKIASGGTRDDLSLVIGTWLTPDLYISYGKNLLKESGSFNTRYLLGYGFSIQTESGESQSGADLKYEIDR